MICQIREITLLYFIIDSHFYSLYRFGVHSYFSTEKAAFVIYIAKLVVLLQYKPKQTALFLFNPFAKIFLII